MLVKNWMSPNVITITEEGSMADAVKLMKTHGIRMLPVTKDGRLTGVVTDRDLKRAQASDATALEIHELVYLLSKVTVKEIMTRKVITVRPDHTVEETAEILLKQKISGAPVVNGSGKLVGVITQVDIFKVLLSLTGLPNRGIQFALEIRSRPGAIQEIIDIFRKYGGRIMNILTASGGPESPDFITVYFRMHGIDRGRMSVLKEDLTEKAGILYIVDYYENSREIFA